MFVSVSLRFMKNHSGGSTVLFEQNCFWLAICQWLGLDLRTGSRCWTVLLRSTLPEIRTFVTVCGLVDSREDSSTAIAGWLRGNGQPQKLVFVLEHMVSIGTLSRQDVNTAEEKILAGTGRSGRWTRV